MHTYWNVRHVLLTAMCLALFLVSGCSSFFFYPEKDLRPNPLAWTFFPEEVRFKASDGVDLYGWLFRAKEPKGSVLVLHGNAQNISTHVNSVLWMVPEGFNVFIFDYRGYGRSAGKPSIEGIHLDAEAALRRMLDLPGIDRDRIVLLGQSLGGSVAVYTAVHSPERKYIKALVIDSVFSSYRRIAREKLGSFFLTWPLQYPLSLFFDDAYSAERFIGKVAPIPLVILHGEQDPIVPVHHGKLLFEAAREPKELWLTSLPGHVVSFGEDEVRAKLVSSLITALSASVAQLNKQ